MISVANAQFAGAEHPARLYAPPSALHAEALGNGLWSLDARTSIDVVNEELGANIPKDRCDTIGGFILMLLGRLPEQGEKIAYGGIEFTVEEVFGYGIAVLHATRVNSSSQGKQRSK